MDIDLRRKIDTEANLLSTLASGKLGIASDTNNIIFVEGSDKGTIVPDKVGSTYRDRTFGAVTAQATTTAALTSVGNIDIGADASNKLVIQDTLCYLMSGGEKIIDYLQANGIIDINAGTADIDTQINGTGATPVIYVDASANNIGVGIITPAEKIHISAAAAGYIRIANTADTLAVIGGMKFTIAGSETARIEAERTVSSGRGSVLKFSTGNSAAITERLRIDDTGGIQINESGAAVDVRIEGDTDANLFVTDGSADKVGIGTSSPETKLHVYNSTLGSVAGNELLIATLAGQDGNNSRLRFKNYRFSNGSDHTTAELRLQKIVDTSEMGYIGFRDGGAITFGEGTSTERMRIDGGGNLIYNESGESVDVRIEGDTDANLLVTDGSADRVGVGVAAPTEKLDVDGNVKAIIVKSKQETQLINSYSKDITFAEHGNTDVDILTGYVLPGKTGTLRVTLRAHKNLNYQRKLYIVHWAYNVVNQTTEVVVENNAAMGLIMSTVEDGSDIKLTIKGGRSGWTTGDTGNYQVRMGIIDYTNSDWIF